ncbi:WXG100 family type VII secretion target [Mycolicibacterium sp. P1-18]|uniref:WXG100 family type VII secretion target n=1 Tax=Mycolicibacterium sp. P1-18 TaxID=2024615 RepID=UPI0011F1B745|nr:WXG100 family type VII secretion target [Mycolicibacterium sp. P1-18]KAA0099982.1 WXG100 family type VII secretion target [Mycolicibacterium sp. P1-18]
MTRRYVRRSPTAAPTKRGSARSGRSQSDAVSFQSTEGNIRVAPTNEVAVDLAALERLVAGIDAFNGQVGAQLAVLGDRVSALHGEWHGDGAEAHRRAHAEWAAGAELMNDGLKRLHEAVAATHSAFNATVQANRALFS